VGAAQVDLGELDQAMATLTETVEESASASEDLLNRRAVTELLILQMSVDPQFDAGAAAREVQRMVDLHEQANDWEGQAKALHALGQVHWLRDRYADAEVSFEQAIASARRAGNTREEARNVDYLAASAVWGPLPVRQGIRRCELIIEDRSGDPLGEARVLRMLAVLRAMTGAFTEARELVAQGARVMEQFGLRLWLAVSLMPAIVETLANEWEPLSKYCGKASESSTPWVKRVSCQPSLPSWLTYSAPKVPMKKPSGSQP
jgi:tetratricopeptide (TPR) repeat protein